MGKGSGGTRNIKPYINVTLEQKNTKSNGLLFGISTINDDIQISDTYTSVLNEASIKIAEIEKMFNNEVQKNAKSIKVLDFSNDFVEIVKSVSGIDLQSTEVYTSYKTMTHHMGGKKEARGKVVSWADKIKMPHEIINMDVYSHNGCLVFTDR